MTGQTFEEELGQAERLLKYAISRGLTVDDKTTRSILAARRRWKETDFSVDEEAAFWAAYRQLALLAQPATPETVSFSIRPNQLAQPAGAGIGVRFVRHFLGQSAL